jgi:ketosteroid isomerase-like protein
VSESSQKRHPNAELIQTMFVAYEAGDLDTLRAVLDEEVVYHIPGRSPSVVSMSDGTT